MHMLKSTLVWVIQMAVLYFSYLQIADELQHYLISTYHGMQHEMTPVLFLSSTDKLVLFPSHKDRAKKKINQRLLLLSLMKHAGLRARNCWRSTLHSSDPYLNMAALSGSAPSQPICWGHWVRPERALRTAFGSQPCDSLLCMSSLPILHERLKTLNYNICTGMKSSNHWLHGLLPSTRDYQYNLCRARTLPLVACSLCAEQNILNSFIPWAVREFDWPTVEM